MGGSSSKIENILTSDLSVNIVTNISQFCKTAVKSAQRVNITADGSTVENVNIKSNIALKQGCRVNQETLDKAVQETAAKMTAEFNKDSTAFSDAIKVLKGDDTKVKNKITQLISSKITTDMVNQCLNQAEATQTVNITATNGAKVKGVMIDQALSMMSSCLGSSFQQNGLTQDLSAQQKTTASYVDTTLTGLADLVKSTLYGWVPAVLGFVLFIALIFLLR